MCVVIISSESYRSANVRNSVPLGNVHFPRVMRDHLNTCIMNRMNFK